MGAGKGYEYRQHAQECLRLADEMGSPEHRALLFDMARAWHQLAQDYERSEWPETVTSIVDTRRGSVLLECKRPFGPRRVQAGSPASVPGFSFVFVPCRPDHNARQLARVRH